MNYNKVIFLDIDGVLVIYQDKNFETIIKEDKFFPFEQSCVLILKK